MKQLALLTLALVAALAVAVSASAATTKTITVKMTGKQETPMGSPTGSGSATITLKPGARKVCFKLSWSGIGKPLASHIHQGKRGASGPIVVPLFAGAPKHKGCVSASRRLINKIIKNPRGYYVNLHTQQFPAGALRGQL